MNVVGRLLLLPSRAQLVKCFLQTTANSSSRLLCTRQIRPCSSSASKPRLETCDVEGEIETRTLLSRNHLTPELALRLITPELDVWHAGSDGNTRASVLDGDPFWSIYWPGGQAVARLILDNSNLVRNKRVFDLGCGCGAAALACALSGASAVTANDIDPVALVAARANALANSAPEIITFDSTDYIAASREVWTELARLHDVLLIGDMFYDAKLGSTVLDLAECFARYELGQPRQAARLVLVGDPGRWFLEEFKEQLEKRLRCVAKYDLPEAVRLENNGFTCAKVFALKV